MNVGFLIEKYQVDLIGIKTDGNLNELSSFPFKGMKQNFPPNKLNKENFRSYTKNHIVFLTKENVDLLENDLIQYKNNKYIIEETSGDADYGFLRFVCVKKVGGLW